MGEILNWFIDKLERTFNPKADMGQVSPDHLFDLNARYERNYWFDKKGQKWPLRDSM